MATALHRPGRDTFGSGLLYGTKRFGFAVSRRPPLSVCSTRRRQFSSLSNLSRRWYHRFCSIAGCLPLRAWLLLRLALGHFCWASAWPRVACLLPNPILVRAAAGDELWLPILMRSRGAPSVTRHGKRCGVCDEPRPSILPPGRLGHRERAGGAAFPALLRYLLLAGAAARTVRATASRFLRALLLMTLASHTGRSVFCPDLSLLPPF